MKSRILGNLSLLLIIATALSCSTETFTEEPLKVSNAVYFDGICSTDCFTPNGYVKQIGEKTVNAGINTKEVSYAAYNTSTDFVVEVTYYVTEGNSKANATITIDIQGNEIKHEEITSGSTVSHSIPLPNDWSSCDLVNYNIRQVALGMPVEVSNTYGLIDICQSGEVYQIGDNAKGGIIAYIFQPEDPGYDPNYQHGLVIAPSDASYNYVWDYNGNQNLELITSTLSGIGTGFDNTQTIVNFLGNANFYSARYCDELTVNGYSDWFLPSQEELKKILPNAIELGMVYNNNPDPFIIDKSTTYWSSTENDFATAFIVGYEKGESPFSSGIEGIVIGISNKNFVAPKVRAVRYF
jgi:hypothetical protein